MKSNCHLNLEPYLSMTKCELNDTIGGQNPEKIKVLYFLYYGRVPGNL